MLDKGCLDLGRRQTVATNVYYVVHAASDPVVALVIAACTVSSELMNFSFNTPKGFVGYSHSIPCTR